MPADCLRVTGPSGSLTILGRRSRGGTYVVRAELLGAATVVFGQFRGGREVYLEPGEYLYVGSALAEVGPVCLARRVVRHATRCGDNPPHTIRDLLLAELPRAGRGTGDLRPRGGKHPKWNIDFLLGLQAAELTEAYLIRSRMRLEAEVGRVLRDDPSTVVFQRGLGAADVAGGTHLLRVDAGDGWWEDLPLKFEAVLARCTA